ncbi:MAG: ImmA/IrrE family metallo-endopeptidase [Deltaproteobacteria bacterium]|jgi:HTH-type transcriptional regulator/antitoxin HigA|nr:ImmA/IrrE family metallo-endopeptidase [Deltaproteobacteria bacterium]
MIPKVIKTEKDYESALARINDLMDVDPGTPEGDELELLVTLVELYEKAKYPIDLPDPVEAIKFRMEQLGLRQKDLIPFIGSRSKVSEVLSRQRPLSIAMIRKLNAGLGLPAEILLREPGAKLAQPLEGVDWERFPLSEMLKRKWLNFQGNLSEARKQAANLISAWAVRLGADALQPALLRQHVRAGSEADSYALAAWRIRVSLLALEQDVPKYPTGTVTPQFVRDLVGLSYLDKGPLLAREYLLKSGIHFVVETHLPHTHLDGAAIKLPDGSPLIAMTLRHDRLDNFWFTLCHELAHVALHFEGEESKAFFDDLDQAEVDTYEKDADQWAAEGLIPRDLWRAAKMEGTPTTRKVLAFAANLRVSPAIPAGRIRKEKGDYKVFSGLIGNKKVRKLFV